jgi:hypothetical protein
MSIQNVYYTENVFTFVERRIGVESQGLAVYEGSSGLSLRWNI